MEYKVLAAIPRSSFSNYEFSACSILSERCYGCSPVFNFEKGNSNGRVGSGTTTLTRHTQDGGTGLPKMQFLNNYDVPIATHVNTSSRLWADSSKTALYEPIKCVLLNMKNIILD